VQNPPLCACVVTHSLIHNICILLYYTVRSSWNNNDNNGGDKRRGVAEINAAFEVCLHNDGKIVVVTNKGGIDKRVAVVVGATLSIEEDTVVVVVIEDTVVVLAAAAILGDRVVVVVIVHGDIDNQFLNKCGEDLIMTRLLTCMCSG
jgi:hypothetical protein